MDPSSHERSQKDSELPQEIIAQAEAVASSTIEDNQTRLSSVRVEGEGTSSSAADAQHSGDPTSSLGIDDHEALGDSAPPPPYDGSYSSVNLNQDGLNTRADVGSDGRVNIRFDQKSNKLSNLLVPALRNQLRLQSTAAPSTLPPAYVPPSLGGVPGRVPPPPPMNVVIHVVGSRGDVQPFVALGQVLQNTYRHRVRLATHPVFRSFVEENGLEFFSIGGDPAELMAFMVKNPGLMPGKDALRSGDIGKRRKGMYEIVRGCWRACFEAGDGTGMAVSDDQPINDFAGASRPFVADAVIANPPSFAHVHVAEKLGVPLHLMFTMPWSPTQAFPHPLANIQSSNADASMTNFVSYAIVEMMTWQGLGDIINRFRESVLGLEPIDLVHAPVFVSRLKIPYTYCWSPALIPKPQDWGRHITISGFYFLSLASNYSPADDLETFLNSGPPPVYIGFGSIVLDDPNSMTRLIFEAVKKTGQRALVSKGWGGVGADELGIPEGVFMLGNVPHDWLFKRVSCVVHHGGAGTTAAGVALGKPTVVVPFFGDQPFWGSMIAKAGAGPAPIPHKQLTAEGLADAINVALKPETMQRAQELGAKIVSEKGTDIGGKSFHDALNVDDLRCSLAPSRVAIWQVKKSDVRLSGLAAAVLGKEGLLDFNQLRLFRYKEYDAEDGPWDPITGGASALMGTISGLMMGVADVPMDIFRAFPRKASSSGIEEDREAADTSEASLLSSPTASSKTPSTAERQSEGSGQSKDNTSVQEGAKEDVSPARKPSSRSPSAEGSERRKGVSLGDAIGAGRGFGRVVDAGIKSPMDFTLSIAKGFHNAPRLYGDTSVRPHEHISGFQSGLKAAGKEFGFGFYDGISGLVTQPLEGAKKQGFSGLAKGFGKGIGGLVLKPAAAIWGIPGYTFKGLYKEMVKRLGSSVQNYIIAARIAQGYAELEAATNEERQDIAARWQAIQLDTSMEQKKRGLRQPDGTSGRSRDADNGQGAASTDLPITDADDKVFEEAIQESVAATSKGNPDEDKWIARAIKASVAELRRAAQEGQGGEALQRAINASIEQAHRSRPDQGERQSADPQSQPKNDEGLSRAMQQSLSVNEVGQDRDRNRNNPDIDTDDDENIKEAMKRSKTDSGARRSSNDELERAIAESLKGSAVQDEEKSKAEEEERVVLEYVKRQSMLEEQHRKTAGK